MRPNEKAENRASYCQGFNKVTLEKIDVAPPNSREGGHRLYIDGMEIKGVTDVAFSSSQPKIKAFNDGTGEFTSTSGYTVTLTLNVPRENLTFK